MFKTYQNISDSYVPNNLNAAFPQENSYTKLDPVKCSRPYEEYDSWGNVVGYFWYQGDSVSLEFEIDGQLTLDDGTPYGSYIDASEYLQDKTICVKIYNFRHEEIFCQTFDGAPIVVVSIDAETSRSLTKGIYYCSLEVVGKDIHETLFSASDCMLHVK